jgi:PhnB protein
MPPAKSPPKTVAPIPPGEPALTPYLIVKGAVAAMAFYVEAFGARELFRLTAPDGKVGHAELELGGGRFMLADEHPDFGALGPVTIGGSPITLHLYVADVDAFVARAVAAGATLLRPVTDEFFGDRVAMLSDPFGHKWGFASRLEEVSPEEMQRRMDAMYA